MLKVHLEKPEDAPLGFRRQFAVLVGRSLQKDLKANKNLHLYGLDGCFALADVREAEVNLWYATGELKTLFDMILPEIERDFAGHTIACAQQRWIGALVRRSGYQAERLRGGLKRAFKEV